MGGRNKRKEKKKGGKARGIKLPWLSASDSVDFWWATLDKLFSFWRWMLESWNGKTGKWENMLFKAHSHSIADSFQSYRLWKVMLRDIKRKHWAKIERETEKAT